MWTHLNNRALTRLPEKAGLELLVHVWWVHNIINITLDLIVYHMTEIPLVCWTDLGNVCVLVPYGLVKHGSDIDTNCYTEGYQLSAMHISTYKHITPVGNTVIP